MMRTYYILSGINVGVLLITGCCAFLAKQPKPGMLVLLFAVCNGIIFWWK